MSSQSGHARKNVSIRYTESKYKTQHAYSNAHNEKVFDVF